MIPQRTFGPRAHVSLIVGGTMRAPDEPGRWPALVLEMIEAGIDTFHSSPEYDSYPSFGSALRQVRKAGADPKHVVKISEPSFDTDEFDPLRLRSRIDAACHDLVTERIEVLQWVPRTPEPSDSARVIRAIGNRRQEIGEVFDELVATGRVGAVAAFPYSVEACPTLLSVRSVTGLCAYLNRAETDFASHASGDRPFLAIRPFAGGSLLREEDSPETPASALRWVHDHRAVTASIISIRSAAHLADAVEAVRSFA